MESYLHEQEQAKVDAASGDVDKCFAISLSTQDNIAAALNRCVKRVRDAAFKTIREELEKAGFAKAKIDKRGEANWSMTMRRDGTKVVITYRVLANNLIGLNYSIAIDKSKCYATRRFTSIEKMLAHLKEMGNGAENRSNPEN